MIGCFLRVHFGIVFGVCFLFYNLVFAVFYFGFGFVREWLGGRFFLMIFF